MTDPATDPATYANIALALAPCGLHCRGGFQLLPADGFGQSKTLVLVGNAGPDFWQNFQASPEAAALAASANPLDQWTRRVVDGVAAMFDATALYPFEGPPYYPFQQWAMRAEPVFPSPIGPLLHPQYGLWHAYRAALLMERSIEIAAVARAASPCDSCVDKPCLSACPVDAFQPGAYAVAACVSHVSAAAQPVCRSHGCLARHACPIGQDFAYGPEQARFHMEKFIESQTGADK